jgi:UDP-N-acetyl-D-glucosamine dehydrogenase
MTLDPTGPAHDLLRAIQARTARVGVVGLGYVGLPLARAFSAAGLPVIGFDTDPAKILTLERGDSYIGHLPPETIRAMRDAGFEATGRFDRLAEADAILICVPTPLTESREPDLSFVVRSVRQIAQALRAGQLVVLESTTYPGTTRDVVLPLLDADGRERGLRCESSYFLAFSPEREDPGNPTHSASKIPKVVGGLGPQSLRLASALYETVVPAVVPVSSPEVAEAAKILENTYRAVNIALVNELKVLFTRMGINIWEVIDAARTKPFGFQPFYPGPGLGGHCIPIDPFYLTSVARRFGITTRFIELAGEINSAMPDYVVGVVADALNRRSKPVNGSRICILGMAYKKDVDDPRESPGFELLALLLGKGACVTYNDPHIPQLPPMRRYPGLTMASHPLSPEFLASQDCVLVATDHSAYDWQEIVAQAPLVVDTRNATKHVRDNRDRIVLA